MSLGPRLEDIFAVMAAASTGDTEARVPLPEEPDLADMGTRFAIGLNVLLDDLAFRVAERWTTTRGHLLSSMGGRTCSGFHP